MNTEEILEKIEKIAKNAPEQLQNISWEDVSGCMKAELDCRRDFYTETSYARISERLHAMALAAESAVRFGNLHLTQNLITEYKGILFGFPDTYENSEYAQRAAFDHAAVTHFREDTTVVIGDSHVNFFSGSDRIYYIPVGNGIGVCPQQNDLKLSTMYLGPCLAYTCTKPDSTAGFYKKFSYLKNNFIKKGSRIMFSLGEIDLRCHVFKEAERTNRDYRRIIEDVLEKYKVLLAQQIAEGHSVYCWGPIGAQKDEVPMDPAFPRYGSEKERNTAAFYFTEKMKEVCDREGAVLLSILEALVDENMETRSEYLSSDRFHLGTNAMSIALPVLQSAEIV